MKKLLCVLVLALIAAILFLNRWQSSPAVPASCPLAGPAASVAPVSDAVTTEALLSETVQLLKLRRDTQAQERLALVLSRDPQCQEARWAEAELLRRNRHYAEAEALLLAVLEKDPRNIPAQISLSNIRYKQGRLDEANRLITSVLSTKTVDAENRALAFFMLGAIESDRALRGWLADKIKYGTKIKGRLLQAKSLAPYLPEVHFALGSFYCVAPRIIGGNIDKAIEELEYAVSLAPEFASACARLAQSYRKKGWREKAGPYIRRVQELDPQNEILSELLK